MARHPQDTPEIERLIRLSAASRARLSQDAAVLRQRLGGPARVVRTLRDHPVRWLGGALATGLVATLLLRRKSAAPKPRRGVPGVLFALALTTVRPIIKTWITVQLKQYLLAQLRAVAVSRPLSNNHDEARRG